MCIYLFLHFPSSPHTLAQGRGGGHRGQLPRQTQIKQSWGRPLPFQPPPKKFSRDQEEAGKKGSRKGGRRRHRPPPPFALCALGEIKNSCVQRVAASATKSVLSGGSCKLFAAPGNQHLGLQNPPQHPPPAPSSPARSCRRLPPTHICHVNKRGLQDGSGKGGEEKEKKGGELALIFGAASPRSMNVPPPPQAVPEGSLRFAAPNPSGCHQQSREQGRAGHQDAVPP